MTPTTPAPGAGTTPFSDAIPLAVTNLVKHFPIHSGVLWRRREKLSRAASRLIETLKSQRSSLKSDTRRSVPTL